MPRARGFYSSKGHPLGLKGFIGILGDPGAASWDKALFFWAMRYVFLGESFSDEQESLWVLTVFLNQFQKHLSTFA